MNRSFDGNDVADLTSVIAEFPEGDDRPGEQLPIKKLSGVFESVASHDDASMKVYLRVRPIAAKLQSTIRIDSSTTIATVAPDSSKRAQYTKTEERQYVFSKVFGPESVQEEINESIVHPLADRLNNGDSCVLIAYGMTNAGKTYTIQGSNKKPGVFPRLVSTLLESSRSTNGKLEISMLEIYQEKLHDLLNSKKEKLFIRDGSERMDITNLTSHPITCPEDAMKLLDTAAGARTKSRTALNNDSSRSHALYTLMLTRVVNNKECVSTFQVVDLAGAERNNRTRGTSAQQKEANSINFSLMQLWRCLNGMKSRKQVSGNETESNLLPFRESKLTHLLMPSLSRSGLAGVAMIACVNPQGDDYDETISILGNASVASKIKEITDVNNRPGATKNHRSSTLTGEALAQSNSMSNLSNKKKRSIEATSSNPSKVARDTNKGARDSVNKADKGDTTSNTNLSKNIARVPGKVAAGLMAAFKAKKTNVVANVVLTDADLGIEAEELSEENKAHIVDMAAEIEALRAENSALLMNQMNKETEIRIEVSNEMAKRSEDLLSEMQNLQNQLNEKNTAVVDVTRSCKKVKQKQRFFESEEMANNLKEAEEELNRTKIQYDCEISVLRTRISELESQVTIWKTKAEKYKNANNAAMANNVANGEAVAEQLSQRLSRDQRFKKGSGAGPGGSVSAIPVPVPSPCKVLEAKSSPGRSPLSSLDNQPAASSPISLHTLAAAQKKGKGGSKKVTKKTPANKRSAEYLDENDCPDSVRDIASPVKKVPGSESGTENGPNNGTYMKRLRSHLRI